MKILQVVHSLPFYNQSGTEIYTQNLSLELSKKHQVFIFSRISDGKEKEYEVREGVFGGIKTYLINNTFRYYNSFELFYENEAIDEKFAQVLDEVRPDIVHFQHLVFLSVGLIKRAKEKKIPLVFTLHDYWLMCPRWHAFTKNNLPCEKAFSAEFGPECIDCLEELFSIKKDFARFYKIIRRILPDFFFYRVKDAYTWCIRKFLSNDDFNINKLKDRNNKIKDFLKSIDFFIAPSQYVENRFKDFGIPDEKMKIVRHGLNLRLTDFEKIKTDRIRFSFIGTLLPAKGVHVLIEAFNRINRGNAELRIYAKPRSYTGFEYYLPYLKKLARDKNIRFMGEFKHNEIGKVFKETDVLVVPSLWYENSPFVIQEAFLLKTPVIASKIGGMPELITDKINGLLFNPADTADLQKKLESIIENRDLLDKFSRNLPGIKGIEENALEIEYIYHKLSLSQRR